MATIYIITLDADLSNQPGSAVLELHKRAFTDLKVAEKVLEVLNANLNDGFPEYMYVDEGETDYQGWM